MPYEPMMPESKSINMRRQSLMVDINGIASNSTSMGASRILQQVCVLHRQGVGSRGRRERACASEKGCGVNVFFCVCTD